MIRIFKLKFNNIKEWKQFKYTYLSNVNLIEYHIHPISSNDNNYHVTLTADVKDSHVFYQYIDLVSILSNI